ncbi:hypothetical protein [Moorena producens]|uniref:hypothetical protein n=1 Tax=Moorena producens TaxID=1155739 RepID=UPI0011EA7131|nr:hypothetical protein [Moorena producens]
MSMIIAIALFCHNPKTKRPVEWASCPLWNGHLARCGMGILPVVEWASCPFLTVRPVANLILNRSSAPDLLGRAGCPLYSY